MKHWFYFNLKNKTNKLSHKDFRKILLLNFSVKKLNESTYNNKH